ncbi:MAG: DUF1015 family protein [Fusicatenibacter sp.]|nr:DUF1015 family protein [Fusicatenibacter sp.]
MVQIRPFAALRPQKGKAREIAALPYDVYSRKEAAEKVRGDGLTFLRIDRPETMFPTDTDMYAPQVYKKADEMLRQMEEKGDLMQDAAPCYYLYELTRNNQSQTGLAVCYSVEEYRLGVVRKHENTRKEKEQDRICHIDACSAQTGPVFLTYRPNQEIKQIILQEKVKEPVYDFVSEDGIGHRLWVVDTPSVIGKLTALFSDVERLYIADGHHRAAAAAAVAGLRSKKNPKYTGKEESAGVLSVLFPEDELKILPYHRVLKDLGGKTPEELLAVLSEVFTINRAPFSPYEPEKKGEMGLYLEGSWYQLQVKPEHCKEDPIGILDVAYLQREVLTPIFGIEDPRTDHRIDFVGGIRGVGELEKRCRKDCKAAFSMYPTSMEELLAAADAGLLMPPKSTWFEPKLRSGLLIHKIER